MLDMEISPYFQSTVGSPITVKIRRNISGVPADQSMGLWSNWSCFLVCYKGVCVTISLILVIRLIQSV